MDFSSSFKRSFKMHSRKISAGSVEDDTSQEEQPILADHHRYTTTNDQHRLIMERSSADRREVIVKVDGVDQGFSTTTNNINGKSNSSIIDCHHPMHHQPNNNMWRDPSYQFWENDHGDTRRRDVFEFQRAGKDVVEDPPSKLIGQFLNKQRAAGGEMSLDVDLEMHELHLHDRDHQDHHRRSTSKELKVSFCHSPPMRNVVEIVPDNDQQYNTEKPEASSSSSSSDEEEDDDHDRIVRSRGRSSPNVVNNLDGGNANDDVNDQVLRCTSFQKRGTSSVMLGRLKTKSRLIDPPPDQMTISAAERKSERIIGKSGPMMKSGMLGRASGMLARASGMLSKTAPDEEEDDPLFDEDLPEDFKNTKLNALTLLQWISLIVIVTTLICSLSVSKWKRKKLRGLELWKWQVLVLVLICGRLVSGWGIRIVVFFIERNFMLRKKVLYFVYGVRRAVQNCIWLGLVLLAWHFMFDRKVDQGKNKMFLGCVNKLMVCMLVATMLWLVKTLMVKVLASSFHVSTYFDRIQESLFNQYVIETLSGPPLIEIEHRREEDDRTMAEIWRLQNAGVTLPPELKASAFPSPRYCGSVKSSTTGAGPQKPARGLSLKVSGPITKVQDDQGITIDHLHRLNHKNISAWNMKRLMRIVRYGALSTLDEQILDTTDGDESSGQIRSEFEAKVAARKIFRNVAKPRSKFIYLEDLMRFLREEESIKVMTLVEGSSESEKISKASLKSWVVNAFRERRALALTLNDTKTAVNKLHQMVNVLVGIIIVIICLVILGIATSKFLLFVSSQVVVVAFIFGNTCKTVFEAIIFLFVMHPFDVGDRCEVDEIQMIVEEMNILNTVFLRYDNQKIMYPNSTLSTRPISNYYRSPDMGDSIDFAVHIATPTEKIALMKQRIISYIDGKKEHWYPGALVVLMNVEDLNKLKMSVWIRHKMNHQDMGERWTRRAVLVEEMVKIFKELDVDYRLYPLDINIRTMPSPTSTRLPSTWTTPPPTPH